MLGGTFVRRPVQLAGLVPIGAFTFGAGLRFFFSALARHPTVLAPLAEETFNQNTGHKEAISRGILFVFTTIPLGRFYLEIWPGTPILHKPLFS